MVWLMMIGGRSFSLPDAPGRPEELKITNKVVRSNFPGVNKLDDDRERGKMLHFLANHEMLAAELMALVLLKFPDAPAEYRRGVYESMREEQMHTLMYLRRMKEVRHIPLAIYHLTITSGSWWLRWIHRWTFVTPA